MVSGRLVWAGDHFTPIEIAQLRRDRERKALAWLDQETANISSATRAALLVLVIPEEALIAGKLLNISRKRHIDPPLGYGDGPNGINTEGRFFTSSARPGRVMILRSGVVEGISQLNALTDSDQRLNLDAIHNLVEENVLEYGEMLWRELNLTGKSAWFSLTLCHTRGLGATATPRTARTEEIRLTRDQIATPALLVDVSQGLRELEAAVRESFAILHAAFGL